MLSFTGHIKESKNTHLTHIEDNVVLNGLNGAISTIHSLKAIREVMNNRKHGLTLSIKFDGAPAIIFGTNPDNGRFFVGTKSVFSKSEPKILYTVDDINSFYSGDLAKKLNTCLTYLPFLETKGILQGDLLYTEDSIKKENIDGETYLTFRPNTITYAVPPNSELGHKISDSQLGIVLHTKYVGRSFKTLKAQFQVSDSDFRDCKQVHAFHPYFTDVSPEIAFGKEEADLMDLSLSNIGRILQTMKSEFLHKISTDEEIKLGILIFTNQQIKSGESFEGKSPSNIMTRYLGWLQSKATSEAIKLKTEEGRKRKVQYHQDLIGRILKDKPEFLKLFDFMKNVSTLKQHILSKLNNIETLKSFIKTDSGYRVSNPEGFVASSNDGTTIKLVDRLDFSRNNFLMNKDWK